MKWKSGQANPAAIGIMLLVFVVLVLATRTITVIEDGQGGLKKTLGKFHEQPLGSGVHIIIPVIQGIERWNVKTQEIKERAEVPSNEGLISRLDVSVLYRTPPDKIGKIRTTIGRNYRGTVLVPYVREAIRGVASGYPVKALYSDVGRSEIQAKIAGILRGRLKERGVMVEDVLLRDVVLPPAFRASIELKLKAEQEAEQKEHELTKAKMDAEIEVARAEGVAKANAIIAESITHSYIQYLWVQGLHDGSSEVIYVPTEANLPILEATRKQGH